MRYYRGPLRWVRYVPIMNFKTFRLSLIEKEAMSLSLLYSCICAFLRRYRSLKEPNSFSSFVAIYSDLRPFSRSYPLWNYPITGP